MERGLSSESNSVSSPPTPSIEGFQVFHLNPSTITGKDYRQENKLLLAGHTVGFVEDSFVDLPLDNSC